MYRRLASLLLAATLSLPLVCKAEDEERSNPVLTYSLQGLTTGAGVGLAAGYLATGWHFEDEEWRTLVFSTGIGALTGVGVGLVLGIAEGDGSRERGDRKPHSVIHYVLRDMNYGLALGAVSGAITGTLYWVEAGSIGGAEPHVATGAAWGALIGTGVGFAMGIIEKSLDSDRDYGANPRRLALGVGFARGPGSALVPYPSVSGSF